MLGHSALISGLMFLPLTALIAATNVVAGRLTSREGPRRPLIVGELILIAGLLAMLVFDATTATAVILVLVIPMGIGGGMVDPAADRGAARGRCRPSAPGSPRGSSTPRASSAAGSGSRCSAGWSRTGSSPGCTSRWSWARSAVAATLVLTLAYVPPDPMGEPEPVGA